MKDNPFIVRGIARWLMLFAGGVLLTVVLLFADIPFWAVFAIIMMLYLLVTMGWPLYIIYLSRNVKKIDAFLAKNRSNAIFGYAYAVGHEPADRVIGALETILQTFKQPKLQAVYAANLAVWQRDAEALHRLAIHLPSADYVNYYTACAVLMEGNTERAETIRQSIRKAWMSHALQAGIAGQAGDRTAYRREAELAAAHSRGVQHYIIVSLFEREDSLFPIPS
ncbi:hypothetical protein [Sporosarcina trichiuri]|uniref:hypothetical protein n=1 Tax=Sporosarcina trichiuri TaxID=3056445 RepID=UPI0025B43B4B|nr:hypothetical protein [Sporosarcina sp. 0.2-SM1T-5]WJY26579.1 hypothetical protein QWT68_10855 [Sporosarcina sp. 0.2-SM1T-5]